MRSIPQNIEAEQSYLANILSVGEIPNNNARIKPSDFSKNQHRLIYQAICQIESGGQPITLVSVVEQLRRSSTLENAGGASYVSSLLDFGINLLQTDEVTAMYADVIKDKSIKRSLLESLRDTATKIYDDKESAVELISQCYSTLLGIEGIGHQSDLTVFKEILMSTVRKLEELASTSGSVGLKTGFSDLDRFTTGFHPGEFIVIAGRPGMGKTALVEKMCLHLGINGKRVAMFSLEMSKEALGMRALSDCAKVPLLSLRSGHVRDSEWTKLTAAAGHYYECRFWVDDTPFLTVSDMERKLRHLREPIDMVVVDYLQLLNPGRTESVEQAIAGISLGLKNLAKRFDVPVVAISQLNRECENRDNKRPRLSDLRYSGAIEQDADLILFVYRDELYCDRCRKDQQCDKNHNGVAELIIAKQRNGPIGTIKLAFLGDSTSFEQLADNGEEDGQWYR